MGRIGKPQKKKKNKIKKYGWYKNNDTVNSAPKNSQQEVPKKLRELGIAIRELQTGRRHRNKFKNKPDGPNSNDATVPPLTKNKDTKLKKIPVSVEQPKKKKMGKKMEKLTLEVTDSYIDDLKPTRPLLENFKFKQKVDETEKQFLRRVDDEVKDSVTRSKIADNFDSSDKEKIKSIIKAKLFAAKMEKKKQKLKDETEAMTSIEKEKKKGVAEFHDLKDEVAIFGEVVHAPPVLSVLPKKATSDGHDRPGLRMPELKQAFSKSIPQERKKGEVVKRKNLSSRQQFESDVKREQFVEAYRQLKKKRKLN